MVAIVSRVMKVPLSSLSPDSGLGTVDEWDSLRHTMLILELEENFDVAFDFDELDKIVTIAAIVESLKAKGAKG